MSSENGGGSEVSSSSARKSSSPSSTNKSSALGRSGERLMKSARCRSSVGESNQFVSSLMMMSRRDTFLVFFARCYNCTRVFLLSVSPSCTTRRPVPGAAARVSLHFAPAGIKAPRTPPRDPTARGHCGFEEGLPGPSYPRQPCGRGEAQQTQRAMSIVLHRIPGIGSPRDLVQFSRCRFCRSLNRSGFKRTCALGRGARRHRTRSTTFVFGRHIVAGGS